MPALIPCCGWTSRSGKFEVFEPYKIPRPNVYDVIPDSQNNGYFLPLGSEEIGRIDAKTGAITMFKTPTPGFGTATRHDGRARIASGSARTARNRIGMFDTRTQKFQEWPAPTPGAWPYDVTVDKNGEAWSGGEYNDRILRLDPQDRPVHRIPAAAAHERAPGLGRQQDDAGDVLGRQQSRRVDREARAARLALAPRHALMSPPAVTWLT